MAFLNPLAEWPHSRKIAAALVAQLLAAGLGFFLLISPRLGERAGARVQRDALQQQIAEARADEVAVRRLRAQIDSLRQRLQGVRNGLPSEKEIPKLYRQITDLALSSGLELAAFAPKPPEDRGDLSAVPIAMSGEGSYHQLGTFFSKIGRLPRAVSLGDFRLTGIEGPTGTVRAEFTLEALVVRAHTAPLGARLAGCAGQGPDQPRAEPR